MASLKRLARAWITDPRLRELLWFCVPALLVGLAIRVWITASMPYGYYHTDTSDFLRTPDIFFSSGHWSIHTKKTFLVPAFFTGALLVPGIAGLVLIPLLQHVLGLVLIFLMGVLVRLWVPLWRWLIVPVTLVIAVNPSMLAYEQMLIAETFWVWTTVLAAVVATMFWKAARRPENDPEAWQEKPWFILLCGAMVLQAGARPEGKLFFILAIALAGFAYWRRPALRWWRIGPLLAVALVTHFTTKTGQAGVLLYTSVAYMTPDHVYSLPGIEAYLQPIIIDHRKGWEEGMGFPRARERLRISEAVRAYFTDLGKSEKGADKRELNRACLRLAMETCVRRFWLLPRHVYYKFRHTAALAPGDDFSERKLLDRQVEEGYGADFDIAYHLSDRLARQKFKNPEDIEGWVRAHYHPEKLTWFNTFTGSWEETVARWRLPDTFYPSTRDTTREEGIPYYMLATFAAILLLMVRPGELRTFHIIFGAFILWFGFVVFLTANVKPRFRFFFEPFWWIYLALLIDMIIAVPMSLFRRTVKETK